VSPRRGGDAIPASRRQALQRRLLAWYDRSGRELPWRVPQGEADPYRAWLAEVMLQQTRVAAAIPYYRRFLDRFPTLASLAEGSEEEVLRLWAGLGYYARGRNLLAAAREAQQRHGGLPASWEALRALPGFGPYTAGAVASIAFGLPFPAVDGNAARVLARLFLVAGRPEDRAVRARIETVATALVVPGRPGDWNQALMELGATHCGRTPSCGRCPVASLCRARRVGRERAIPPPRRRGTVRRLTLACAVFRCSGCILLLRRASRGLLGGLWELPSASVGEGERSGMALARALSERGLRAEVGEELAAVERALTHRRLTLVAHACRLRGRPPAAFDARWASAGEVARLGLSTAMRRLVERI